MDLVYNILVALHLLGMAAVVGGWIAVRSGRTVIAPIVWGARAQLVTGLLLVGIASAITDDDHTVDNTKIAVKLVIALGVLAAAEIGAARGRKGATRARSSTSRAARPSPTCSSRPSGDAHRPRLRSLRCVGTQAFSRAC